MTLGPSIPVVPHRLDCPTGQLHAVLVSATTRLVYEQLCRTEGTRSLGEVATIVSGGTPSKRNSSYWGGSLPWAAPRDLKPYTLTMASEGLTQAAVDAGVARINQPPATLIVTRGMILARYVPVVHARIPFAANQDIRVVRPTDGVDGEYLSSVLLGAERYLFERVTDSTAGQRRIETADLRTLPVPVPSPRTQRAVASFLRALLVERDAFKVMLAKAPAAMRRTMRTVAKIEQLAAKIDEARGLRGSSGHECSALLSAARRTAIGDQPHSDWRQLDEVVPDIENGWSPACHKHPATDGKWGVLKVGAVSFGTFDPTENKELPATLKPKPQYEIAPGDFLMSRANTVDLVGACAIVRETPARLLLCDKIFRFRFASKGGIDPAFLDQTLKSPALRRQIEIGATGTSPTMKNIAKAKIMKLRLPVPPIEKQRRIVAHLGSLQEKADRIKALQAKTAAELDALLPAILDKAFKGELE